MNVLIATCDALRNGKATSSRRTSPLLGLRCPSPQLQPCSLSKGGHIIEAGIPSMPADLIHGHRRRLHFMPFSRQYPHHRPSPVIRASSFSGATLAVVTARRTACQHARGARRAFAFHRNPSSIKISSVCCCRKHRLPHHHTNFTPPRHSVNLFLDFWQIAQLS